MRRTEPFRLKGVFDAIDIGLIVLDPDARVQEWNGWMAAASGISADEARCRRLDEIFAGPPKARLQAAITGALEAGMSSILTHLLHAGVFPLRDRGGRSLIHNVLVRPFGEAPVHCLMQVTDVTLANQRERVLRERQNARYDAVVDSVPDAIVTLDTDGIIRLANPAAGREFGYPTADLVGRPISLLLDDDEAWHAAWAALLGGKMPLRPIEVVARRADGSPSFVEITASRWQTESRVFVTAILRDVNERRAVEAAQRRLNQTLERLVAERTEERDRMWRLSSDVMLAARLDGAITAVNPACSALLGWNEAELRGAMLGDFVVVEDAPILAVALRDLARSPAPVRFELRLRGSNNAERRIAWNAVAADELMQAVGRDVTAERDAEEALHRTEEALRQSQKMEAIGQLTGGIAHDFNNMLTGIIGSMNILRRRIAARRFDDVERFMEAATASAERAAALIHRLLAFARRQPLDPRALDVNALIESMGELLHRSLGEQIKLEIVLGQEIWPILTDANQLENALLNLAINGRDAMPEGGTLRIETANVSLTDMRSYGKDDMEPGDYTLVTVADTGVGMPPEVLAQAFDPFFTTKPIGQGTGLGLSMIYGFVKQSRGHVRIESAPGRGTEVKLFLPRHRGALTAEDRGALVEAPHGEGETVLLVEDDPSVRLLIAEVLRDLGYACLEARDGQAALPILASDKRLDLMITDVGLPGLNGRQIAEIGRQHRPELKVLFVTGYAEHATSVRGGFLEKGMGIVTKPFAPDALAVRIREMIAG